MQDEIEKLDKEISERHAEELAALDKRLSAENEGGDAGSLQELADALQSTQIADGATKVTCRKPRYLAASPRRHGCGTL